MRRYLKQALGGSWAEIVAALLAGIVVLLWGQLISLAIAPALMLVFRTVQVIRNHRQKWSSQRQTILAQLQDQLGHFSMLLPGTSNEHSVFQAVGGLRFDSSKGVDSSALDDVFQRFRDRQQFIFRLRRILLNQIQLARAERRLSDEMLALFFEQTTEMVAEYEATVKDFRKVCDRDGILLAPAATETYEAFREEHNQWLKRYRDELCPSVTRLVADVAKPNRNMVTTLAYNRSN